MRNKEQSRRLVDFRKSLNMTALEFATRCGVSGGAWSQYEQGRVEPTLETLLRMKSCANKNNIHLDDSLFSSGVKKDNEDVEITFTTNSLIGLREKLGLSREIISKECGITSNAWGRYERGERGLFASTYFRIRAYARQHGVDLQTPIIAEEKKEKVIKVRSQQDNSMRLLLTQVA